MLSVLVRAWLNWKLIRRRRWARLTLLWLHVLFACLAGWGMYEVARHIVFYPYWMMDMLLVLICICAILTYLLARKDVALWCRIEVPSNRQVESK